MKKVWPHWNSNILKRIIKKPRSSSSSEFFPSFRLNQYLTRAAGFLILLISFFLAGTFAVRAQQSWEIFMPLTFANWDGEQQPGVVITAANDLYQAKLNSPLITNATEGVLANDTITNSDQLQAVLVENVSHGTLKLEENGSFEYSPNSDFAGQDKFTYQATNGTQKSNLAKVTLTVGGENEAPLIVTGEVAFTKSIVGELVPGTHSVVAADFEGDGDMDVVSPDYWNGVVYLFTNDGNGNFSPSVLDPDLEGAYPSHVADVDKDGDMDVFVGGYLADVFAWYRNDGGSFTRVDIDTTSDGPHSLVTIDLDDDDDIDLVTTSQDGNTVAWYENDGSNNFTPHIIDNNALKAKRAEVADFDDDGDLDIVAASNELPEIAWYKNDGNEQFTKKVIDTTSSGAYYVSPADIDGDGDFDFFSASQWNNHFAWFQNDGAGNFALRLIDNNAIGGRSIVSTDLDRDGDIDAVAAAADSDTCVWFENDGDGNFTKHIIDPPAGDAAYGQFPIDIDYDGDIDVLTANRDSWTVDLHSQYRAHQASVNKGGTLLIDANLLKTIDAEDGPDKLTYTVVYAPGFGELRLDGAPLSSGGTFTQQDVNDKLVTYVHNGMGVSSDAFSFVVAGAGSTGFQPADGSFTIKINTP